MTGAFTAVGMAAGMAAAGLAVVPGMASAVAPSGAELVVDLASGRTPSSPSELTAVGDELFFIASTDNDDDHNDTHLWRVKTGSAPQRVVLPGVATLTLEGLTNVNGVLHFVAYDGTRGQVWRLDGSTPHKVTNFAVGSSVSSHAFLDSSIRNLTAVGGTLFFTAVTPEHGHELWKSAGGPATMVRDFTPGPDSTSFQEFEAAGDRLFFTAGGPEHNQLWAASSSGAGATQVTNLTAPEGSNSYARAAELTAVGDHLYFRARDAGTGTELWKSNGTPAGTALVLDIAPGASSSWPTNLVAAGDKLYFTAVEPDAMVLWQATGAGASKVVDVGAHSSTPQSTVAGGTLFFTRFVDDSEQLWRLNGSALQQLTTFPAGSRGVDSNGMVDSGGNLYFGARDGVHGDELWTSDGTVSGTGLVANIAPQAYGSAPFSLTDVAGTLYFSADDSVHGRELWRTTGPAPTPTPDRAVTGFKASAKSQQKVGKKVALKVKAGAGERVTLKLTTTVKIKGKKGSLKLKTATVKTSAGQQKTVGLKASKSVTKKLLKALKQYRGAKSKKARDKRAVTATVTIRATDAAGNVKTKKVKIRLV